MHHGGRAIKDIASDESCGIDLVALVSGPRQFTGKPWHPRPVRTVRRGEDPSFGHAGSCDDISRPTAPEV